MAEVLKPGASSPKVAAMQKLLNAALPSMGLPRLPENGAYDDATQAAVAALQVKANVGYSSGIWDAATQAALVRELKPKYLVTVDGKQYCLTAEEWEQVKAAAGKKAADAVQPYVNMANEAMIYWKAHDDCRKGNWFWSNAIEVATGANFPDKSVMDKALAAANAMQQAAASGKLQAGELSSRSDPIRQAFAAMDQYRFETFEGGEQLAKNLQTIADGCVVTLKICAVFVPGGTVVVVGLAAGTGGYEELIKQIGAASKDPAVTVGSAGLAVFKAAVIDGAVALIMKGQGKGLEKFADKIAEEAIKKAGSATFKAVLKQYAIRAMNGAAKKVVEDALKGMGKLLSDPKATVKPDDFIKAAVEAVLSGMAVGVLGPAAEKFAKGASGKFSAADFAKYLGNKGDYQKALKDGLENAIQTAAGGAVKTVLDSWTPEKNPSSFDAEVKKKILEDKGVQAAAAKAGK